MPAEDEEFVEDEFDDELDGSLGEEPGESGKTSRESKAMKYGAAQRQLRRALRLKPREVRGSPPSARILENLANNAEPHQFQQVQDAVKRWHEHNLQKPNSRLPEIIASRFARGGAAVKAAEILANRDVYRMDAPSLSNLYSVFRGLAKAQAGASEGAAPAGPDAAASAADIVKAAFILRTVARVYHPEASADPLVDTFVLAAAVKNGETDSERVQALIRRAISRGEEPTIAYAADTVPHKWARAFVDETRAIAVALVEQKHADVEFFAHLAERLMEDARKRKARG